MTTEIIRYLAVRDALPTGKIDLLMVLGSADVRTPVEAANLYLTGQIGKILVVGGIGTRIETGESLGGTEPEAVVYGRILQAGGVPPDAIYYETASTNTGENIIFGIQILKQHGMRPQTVVLLHSPLLQRRAKATFDQEFVKYVPDVRVYNWAAYLPEEGDLTETGVLSLPTALGEIERLENYGPDGKGYIVQVDLPDDLRYLRLKLRLNRL
jgi:uncharacterized SAM-binding protein YcdF (DUF218 family)